LDNPLVGFNPPSRYFPKPLPTASRPRAPLLGFLAPSTHKEKEVHGPTSYPARPPGVAGILPTGPTPLATVSLPGFPNLSAIFSFLHRPAIFRQVALLGFTLQGFTPLTKPRQLITPACPPDVAPTGCASSHLGGGSSRRATDCLESRGRSIFRLQGFCPRQSRSASPSHHY
jgi:hypothetical protein